MWLKENKLMVFIGIVTVMGIYVFLDAGVPTAGREVTAAELGTDLPKMVELYTPSCPSCRAMGPTLSRIEQKCTDDKVGFDKIDLSKRENAHLVDELDVLAVPTFVFLDENGKETLRLIGKQTEETLRKHLASIGGRCS